MTGRQHQTDGRTDVQEVLLLKNVKLLAVKAVRVKADLDKVGYFNLGHPRSLLPPNSSKLRPPFQVDFFSFFSATDGDDLAEG